MKRLSTITVVLVALAGGLAHAATDPGQDEHRGSKAALIFGNSIAGAIIAGPVGFVAGAINGIWLSERVIESYALDGVESDLRTATAANAELRGQLMAQQRENTQLQRLTADSLELQVLFHTGNSELDASSARRVAQLARFLASQPSLTVRLSGYADPRGDEAYNEQLSAERVAVVATLLESAGISAERISAAAHGASQSAAVTGDLDAYALERRVSIELVPAADASQSVAKAR